MAKKYSDYTKDDLPVGKSNSKTSTNKTAKPSLTRIGTKTTQAKDKKTAKKSVKTTAKASKMDAKDLERLNNERVTRHSFRSRRNRVIIVVLILLLLLSIGGFTAYYFINKLDNNCFVTITGSTDAVCFVDGKELTEFKTPLGIKGSRTYEATVEVETKKTGNYTIEFEVLCYQNGELLENTGINYNIDDFKHYADDKYRSKTTYTDSVKVELFSRIYLSEQYEQTLSYGNFKMEIKIYIIEV